MKLIHLLMEPVIKDSQIPVRTLDHPVCHDLSGDMDVIPQEFLADPVKRKPVYDLAFMMLAASDGVSRLLRSRFFGRPLL